MITVKLLNTMANEAYDSLMETLNNHLFPEDELKAINDETPVEDLPLYITDKYSPITRLLAKHRLAGKSVWDPELQTSLERYIFDGDVGSNIPLDFETGQLHVLYKLLMATKKNLKRARLVMAWALWSPYN